MLQRLTLGGGRADIEDEHARLVLRPAPAHALAIAQLDDHHGLRRDFFPHRPPIRVTLYARSSRPAPAAMMGFGFWNDPFGESSEAAAPPQCVWFLSMQSGRWSAAVWSEAEGIRERALAGTSPTGWRRFEIEWRASAALFRVDGVECLRTAAPSGPLGLVITVSNRVVAASAEAQFRVEQCEVPEEQWLEVKSLRIDRSPPA